MGKHASQIVALYLEQTFTFQLGMFLLEKIMPTLSTLASMELQCLVLT